MTIAGAEMMDVREEMMPRDPAPSDVQSCRVCGCWFWDACWDDEKGACWWVEEDLCSHCLSAPSRVL